MSKVETHHVAQRDMFSLRAKANNFIRQVLVLLSLEIATLIIYIALIWGSGPLEIMRAYTWSNIITQFKNGWTVSLSVSPRVARELAERFGTNVTPGKAQAAADVIADNEILAQYIRGYLRSLLRFGLISSTIVFGGGLACYERYTSRLVKKANRLRHIRGNRLMTARQLSCSIKNALKKRKEQARLSIKYCATIQDPDATTETANMRREQGEIPVPLSCENQHIMIAGRSRQGKSVFTKALFLQIRNLGAKGIIHDPQGEYVASFYNPETDFIFNPLDERGLKWNFMSEVEKRTDIDAMAEALIPVPANLHQPYFNRAAQDVFRAAVNYCYLNEQQSNAQIWEVLKKEKDKLYDLFHGVPGAEAALSALSAKEAPSVMSTYMQHVSPFEYMASWDGDSFTTRAWLASDKPGFIFCLSTDDVAETSRPILSLFTDALIRNFLSMTTDLSRRIYFILDEFPELQKLSAVDRLLRMGGKKGASVVLGTQGIGKINATYGKDLASEMFNNLGNSVVFAVQDPAAMRYFSEIFGRRQIERHDVSRSQGTGIIAGKDHEQVRTIQEVEDLILPSEIQGLSKLTCYLKLAGFNLTKIEVPYVHYVPKNPEFQSRESIQMNAIKAEYELRRDREQYNKENDREQFKTDLKKRKTEKDSQIQDLISEDEIRDI